MNNRKESNQLVTAWQQAPKTKRADLYVLDLSSCFSKIKILKSNKDYEIEIFKNVPDLYGYIDPDLADMKVSLDGIFVYSNRDDFIFTSMEELRSTAEDLLASNYCDLTEALIGFAKENSIRISTESVTEYWDEKIAETSKVLADRLEAATESQTLLKSLFEKKEESLGET